MIESTLGVCGGAACIGGTRIPMWGLEQARRLGTTERQLLECCPVLCADDLAEAWSYVEAHRGEIERDICDNEEA